MKGKIWELGPFVLAALVGAYFIVDHFRRSEPDPVLVSAPGRPLTGSTPRPSTGPGDPTRPEDFLPDPDSKPDPHSLPDPSLSTATRVAPAKR